MNCIEKWIENVIFKKYLELRKLSFQLCVGRYVGLSATELFWMIIDWSVIFSFLIVLFYLFVFFLSDFVSYFVRILFLKS